MAKKLDLTGLSTEEIAQINSGIFDEKFRWQFFSATGLKSYFEVLARNEAIQNAEQKRIKWLKFRTFGAKGERDFLGSSLKIFHRLTA